MFIPRFSISSTGCCFSWKYFCNVFYTENIPKFVQFTQFELEIFYSNNYNLEILVNMLLNFKRHLKQTYASIQTEISEENCFKNHKDLVNFIGQNEFNLIGCNLKVWDLKNDNNSTDLMNILQVPPIQKIPSFSFTIYIKHFYQLPVEPISIWLSRKSQNFEHKILEINIDMLSLGSILTFIDEIKLIIFLF